MKLTALLETHLDEAAALFALEQRARRATSPLLPAAPEDPEVARSALRALWQRPRTRGVAAIDDEGRLIAFLLGMLRIDSIWGRSAWIPALGHARAPGTSPELYRDLYAELAAYWVRVGCFTHYAMIPATGREALDAFYSLGFGQEQAHAARSIEPLDIPTTPLDPTLEIRRAHMGDLDALLEVAGIVLSYQGGPPVFAAFLPEFSEDWESDYRELLEDDENRIWIAARGSQIIGFNILSRATPDADDVMTPDHAANLVLSATRPEARSAGIGRVLLNHALRDALALGYQTCIADWRTPNLAASRFWPRLGFTPMIYRLSRRVDPRTAWARGGGFES